MKRLDLLRYLLPVQGRLGAVEAELERILHSDVAVAERLATHVRSGRGKRLRPALVLLASRFCGASGDADVRFGAVFELVHTATLVHDDVIDHATVRRGAPTLNKLWGNTLTVLFGDLLYLHAMTSAIAGRSWRMMEIFSDVTTRMIEGELIQNDVLFNIETTRQDYFEIQERKTALLFAGCTETGAVLAGWGREQTASLRTYGLELGRAFQLVDDLLDYTASADSLGKPVLSDLREGKLTLPLLTLLERDRSAVEPLIREAWECSGEASLPQGLEQRLRGLIDQHDALSETRQLAARASEVARESLRHLPGDPGIQRLLMEIPEYLLARTV